MGFKIKWINNNVKVTYTGVVDFGTLEKVNNLIIRDSRFDNIDYTISDFLNADENKLSDKDVKIMALLNKNASVWNKKIKMALVFSDLSMMPLAEKYKETMQGSNWPVQFFDNLADAEKWCMERE